MPNAAKPKILIVDDEIELRELIKDQLEYDGFDTKSASHGGEALEIVKAFEPQLVISDINMPHMDGIQLLEKILLLPKPHPRVILCTGFDGYEVANLRGRGAFALLTKPFGFEELSTLVTKALETKPE